MARSLLFSLFVLLLLAGCAAAATPAPAPTRTAAPTTDARFAASGGGDPRSAGYWQLWNTCAEENRAETARANGGRAAGWILMDDLLEDPGMLVGALAVETCAQGLHLLRQQDLSGEERASDAAYQLAAQLLAAQLNLAAGAETCPAAEQAVRGAQDWLLRLPFDGSQGYFGPPRANPDDAETSRLLEDLAGYNSGALCR